MSEETLDKILNFLKELIFTYGPKILLAIITLAIGWWLINFFIKILRKRFEVKDYDEALEKFILILARVGLRILLFVTVIGMLGVETTSFVALLGAAGLAIGLSLQGSLSNFAGGILIITTRPFKIGHYIEAQGVSGSVQEIGIIYTTILSANNQKIVIPNGQLANGNIINYSSEETRCLSLVFKIRYEEDLQLVKSILHEQLNADSRIPQDPKPQVLVNNLNEVFVEILVKSWPKTSDYWDLRFDLIENIKIAFDKNKIAHPYPQAIQINKN